MLTYLILILDEADLQEQAISSEINSWVHFNHNHTLSTCTGMYFGILALLFYSHLV